MARRLAAILAADVVGYSRLMAVDEAGTHARLKALRQDFIEPKITSITVASSSSWATARWSSSPAWSMRSNALRPSRAASRRSESLLSFSAVLRLARAPFATWQALE
jgi:hypothetical protein